MEKERLEEYKEKKVFLILKSGHKYTGVITSINEDTISFIDKFNNQMLIAFSDIMMIQKQGDGVRT